MIFGRDGSSKSDVGASGEILFRRFSVARRRENQTLGRSTAAAVPEAEKLENRRLAQKGSKHEKNNWELTIFCFQRSTARFSRRNAARKRPTAALGDRRNRKSEDETREMITNQHKTRTGARFLFPLGGAPRPKIRRQDPRNDHKPTQNSNESAISALPWGLWGERRGRKSEDATREMITNHHKTRTGARLFLSSGGGIAAEKRRTGPQK